MNPALAQRFYCLQKLEQNQLLQQLIYEQCRRDPAFWINHFCWTFDPRLSQPHQPFMLYPFQETALETLRHCLESGEDLLIEKSRDMGMSWLILLLFQHHWLFRDGAHFHLGSRKLETVDRKGDLSTLLEKLRYNLSWLPAWMLPAGFSPHQHDNLLRLVNPANGNSITGESSNANFGRGGRYRAVLFDEFPFWPEQDAAFASAGQSTPCRLLVGTPYGSQNRFAELRFGGQIRVLSVHWSAHPLKTSEWYATQKSRMSEDELARELDMNYHLSVRNRVFKTFGESHKQDLSPMTGMRIVRSWDFGYHCPACLFIQVDDADRVLVLREVVGHQDLLIDFAKRVLEVSQTAFSHAKFEDVCDPAGSQRSDKNTHTSIEILNSLGIYPYHDRSLIRDGLELIRMKLAAANSLDHSPGLLVDRSCQHLIAAFEGGYRYSEGHTEQPLQEHPYEDVMDCLRYAVMYKCGILIRNPKQPKPYRSKNRYTGY